MNLAKLSEVLKTEPKFRYQQINKALFQDFISDWQEVSNLPKVLREKLVADCPLEITAEIIKNNSQNKSVKALITLADGETIETVLIRQKNKPNKDERQAGVRRNNKHEAEIGRNTVCVSSQVGCALACEFCATGNFGFRRNLQAEEIVEQVIFWARYLKQEGKNEKVDNVVFMGMGEPFLNYSEFIKAVKFLNDGEKLNLGARRMSVSTAGIVEGIKRLAGEKIQINLAISLHAPQDRLRQELMPIAKKYSLSQIFRAVDNYLVKTGRRVMFEYLMIKDVNDRDEDARELVKLISHPLYLVNLIPYNSTGRFKPSSREQIEKFKNILIAGGVPATVRLSFGADISAACGQLRGKK